MKKLFFAAAIICAAFITSCNSAGADPKTTLVAFFDALSKKDIDGARKLATTDSKAMLDLIEMGMKMGNDNKDMEKYDKTKVEFGEPKIEGDKAIIPMKDKKSGEGTNFTLKKENGAWKVAFDKATMGGMAMDKMKEGGDSLSTGLDKLKDVNFDSLGDKMKDAMKGLEKLKDNKELQDLGKKLEDAMKEKN